MGSSTHEKFDVRKFDGTNFSLWKEQIQDVLIQRKQFKPLMGITAKPVDMKQDDWDELDALARSTIRLYLADSVYFMVVGEKTTKELWDKLCSTYEKETASNKVFLMKKIFALHMKEGTSITTHLNEFNVLFSQLQTLKMPFDAEIKAIFLLCSLPPSWDTFCTAVSNSAPKGVLKYEDIVGSLLSEEIRRKSLDSSHKGAALSTERGRTHARGKSRERGRSRSKSRPKRDIECFHCGKKGHYKKDCFAWKREQKKKKPDSDEKRHDKKEDKGKAKVEEINATHDDGDVLLTTSFSTAFLTTSEQDLSHDWILDSGASFHVTPSRDYFVTYTSSRGTVRLGNDYVCDIIGIGDVHFTFPNGQFLLLKNVRHIPQITKNLLSSGQLDDAGYSTVFGNQSWKILKGSLIVSKGPKMGTLYPLRVSSIDQKLIGVMDQPDPMLWHHRLGHMSLKGMKVLSRFQYLPAFIFSDLSTCEHCMFGKQTRSTHPYKGGQLRKERLSLVHSDVCGPMPTRSLGGAQYFVTFIDDATRKTWVYPIAKKSDTFSVFQRWLALVEKETSTTLKCLRSDNGGEYMSNEFADFCDVRGIKRELTAPYTPSQNGVAERMNRTIQERTLCMLSHAGLSKEFWGEAVKTAVHLINRSPSKALDEHVPEEAWSGKQPTYHHLRVFGCEAYVHVPKELHVKLDPKSSKCIFMGYGESGEMGYRLWDVNAHRLVRSSDVVFNETKMFKRPPRVEEYRRVVFRDVTPTQPAVAGPNQPQNAPNGAPDVAPQGHIDRGIGGQPQEGLQGPQNLENQAGQQPENQQQFPRRSTRPRHPPERYVPGVDYLMLTDCGEPSCYKEAMSRDDKKKWESAMKSEMDSLTQNQTWKLVPLPAGKHVLPNKWVFKLKTSHDGSSPKYKARLVAKGFKQEYGVDFDEIFSPVVKMSTLRVMLALVATQDLDLVQMDVKTAFLHGDLDEELYMAQPEGFVTHGKEKYVCRLQRSLYGLKQAPRQWYQKFDAFMHEQGFQRSSADACLYTKKAHDGSLLLLALYVDDILFAGRDSVAMDALKTKLMSTFAMKDLGEASHILGVRISRDRAKGLLFLSQEQYIDRVLQRFHMEGGKTLSTPLPPHVKLSARDCPSTEEEKGLMSGIPYASACGSLMYAMIATRPDIAFAVGVVSRFMANPGKTHWEAVKGILRYLKGTKAQCLCFGSSSEAALQGFVDADMAGDADSRRSTTGVLFTFFGGAVSWVSRLQKCISISTTEAEYVAATEAAKDAIWLHRLVGDLGFAGHVPVLHCDSQSAIQLAHNPVFHSKTKHIDLRYHFIRQVVEDKLLQLVKIHTSQNPADLLTKSLPSERFVHCRTLMGIG